MATPEKGQAVRRRRFISAFLSSQQVPVLLLKKEEATIDCDVRSVGHEDKGHFSPLKLFLRHG